MRNSLALRLIGGASIWLAVALALSGFGLSEVFDRQVTATYQRQLMQQVDRLAAGLEWTPGGTLSLVAPPSDPAYRRPYSGRYWQVSGEGGIVMRSDSLWDQSLALPDPPGPLGEVGRHVVPGPAGQSLLLAERSVALVGRDVPVRLAVAVDRAELATANAEFNRLLSASLLILGLGLMLAVAVQIMFGLWPLKRLQRSLAMLRNRRQQRLSGAWPVEVRPLVDEINELLERDEALLERTRRQAADLAHGLKTPLAVLANEAGSGDDALHGEVGRQVDVMRKQIERHLARARTAGLTAQNAEAVDAPGTIRELARTLARIHGEKLLDFEIEGTGRFAGDRQDFAEMLGNLMDNACRWAKSRIAVSLLELGGRLRITIDDDGPGMTGEQRERALERYGRLDESAPGSGLGLAIVADIASMYGGSLLLDRAASGGLRVVLELPAHPPG